MTTSHLKMGAEPTLKISASDILQTMNNAQHSTSTCKEFIFWCKFQEAHWNNEYCLQFFKAAVKLNQVINY
jgi:hypothetical protein